MRNNAKINMKNIFETDTESSVISILIDTKETQNSKIRNSSHIFLVINNKKFYPILNAILFNGNFHWENFLP